MIDDIPFIPLSERPAVHMWHQQGYTAAAGKHAAALREARYGNAASFARMDSEEPEPPLLTQIGEAVRAARQHFTNG